MNKILLIILLSVATFANIGTIMAVSGDAQVKRSQNTLSVKSGMALLKGDEIVTQTKTKVQVMLNDDTAITIGPSSSFAFLDFLFDGSKKSIIDMKVTRGFFRSVTGEIGKIAPERFKVKTNLATIGIRGTDFSAQLEKDKALYRCYRGEIKVSFADKERSVVAGDMLHLHLDGLDIKEVPMTKTNAISQFKSIAPANRIKLEDISNLSDISEIKEDIQDVKYDCQQN